MRQALIVLEKRMVISIKNSSGEKVIVLREWARLLNPQRVVLEKAVHWTC